MKRTKVQGMQAMEAMKRTEGRRDASGRATRYKVPLLVVGALRCGQRHTCTISAAGACVEPMFDRQWVGWAQSPTRGKAV